MTYSHTSVNAAVSEGWWPGEGGPAGHEPGATICRIDTRCSGSAIVDLYVGLVFKVSQLLNIISCFSYGIL